MSEQIPCGSVTSRPASCRTAACSTHTALQSCLRIVSPDSLTTSSLHPQSATRTSVQAIENETGLTLEHPSIVDFRQAVLRGEWKSAEELLLRGLTAGAERLSGRSFGSGRGLGSFDASGAVSLDLALRSPERRGLEVSGMMQRELL